jgi:hypothetical protein
VKIINSILYIEFNELTDCGISSRTVESWDKMADPEDKRKKLIAFEDLREKYKELIIAKYGNPYKYIANSIITAHLVSDQKDIDTINNYQLPDETFLSHEYKAKYIEACKYLHLLSKTSPKTAKQLGFDSMRTFNDAVATLITANNVSLPGAYAKLKAKVREYHHNGASCVISKKFGNTNTKKVKDEVSEATLLSMIAHHNQFDWTFVAIKYNEWAKANNKATITAQTVGNYAEKHRLAVDYSRKGSSNWRNFGDKTVKQSRPRHPLALINSDDNTLDLYFIEERKNAKGHIQKNYYFRYSIYVVMDSFNDYILGYAVGETITEDVVRMAYLNAIHHVREITGDQLIWKQIKADHWGLKSLKPFYEQQATFTPPKLGNARGKIIEQAFGKMHTELAQYINYAGHNITAGQKMNTEALEKNKRSFPTKEQGIEQIAHFIELVRNKISSKTGKSKRQEWLDAYNETPIDKKRQLSDQNRLLWFGKVHEYSNQITNRGIEFTLKGRILSYDVPTVQYVQHIGKTIKVVYDPYDLTKILATDETQRLQILCSYDSPIPMAIADMTDGDRARLNVKLREKRMIQEMASSKKEQWAQIAGKNAESLMQAGVLTKEIKNAAERILLNPGSTDVFDNIDIDTTTENNEPARDVWDGEIN